MHSSARTSTERLLDDTETYPDIEEYGACVDADTLFDDPPTSRELEKRLLRKLDLRVAFLVLVFIVNFMDRSNIASARLKGLEEDLHMTGQQFNDLVSIFYVGYVLMQIPSNIFLNQLRTPSAYISCCIFLWGIISIGTGAAQSIHAVLIYRFLLGFLEAVFYPGVLFILSTWYKCDELGLRMAYLTCGASLSTAFGSFVESGILTTMDGKLGYTAWRWLFFIEGGLTCAIALAAFYLIPDFPTTRASWLTDEEQMLAQKRMNLHDLTDDSLKSNPFSGLLEALTDWTVWWLATALIFLNTSLSFITFFPAIVATMGYSPAITLLLCAPPQILNVVTSFFVTSHSDMTRERFWHITGPMSMGIVGFVIAISTMNNVLRYLSLFFMYQSVASYVVVLAWANESILESSSKRAVVLAFLGVSASIGDIVSAYLWPASWGPSYSKSFLACILVSFASIGMLWVYRLHHLYLKERMSLL
ncbi:major facilitator superfamily domain-containing protein [Scleroderma yunnanense]